MSTLFPLIQNMFLFDAPILTIRFSDAEYTVSADTITECKINSLLVKAVRNEQLSKARRHWYVDLPKDFEVYKEVFPFVLHYLDTKHMVYPLNSENIAHLLAAFKHFEILEDVQSVIKAKDSPELTSKEMLILLSQGCVKSEESGDEAITSLEDNNYIPSKKLRRESLMAVAKITESDRRYITLFLYGQSRTLKQIFPLKEIAVSETYRNLNSVVELTEDIPTEKDFLCVLGGGLVHGILGKMGFRLTCYSTFTSDPNDIFSGMWLFYRERPNAGMPSFTMTLRRRQNKGSGGKCCLFGKK